MRGHWLSQTRKLNRHYQSAGTGVRVWDGSKDLCPADCFVAPSYALMNNGQMINAIPYSSLVFEPSPMDGIDMCKIDCTVEPYIPKIADNYFPWNEEKQGVQKEVTWFADKDFKIYYPEGSKLKFIEHPLLNTIPIPEGTDFSSLKLPLIVPEYDVYVLRRSTEGGVKTKELFDQLGGGKCTYNFKVYNGKDMSAFRLLFGKFGNETSDVYLDASTGPTHLNDISNRYVGWDNVCITGAIYRNPWTTACWSGRQTLTGIITGCISRFWNENFPGCAHGDDAVYGITYFYRLGGKHYAEYAFAMMYILKSLKKEERTITG